MLGKHVLAGHVQQLARVPKTLVDRYGLVLGQGKDGRAQVLQQNFGQLHDRLGGAVILLHQLLAGAPVRLIRKTQALGDGRLMVEQQAVFLASHAKMQQDAQLLQKPLALRQALLFEVGDKTMAFQITPAVAVACGLRNPQNRLQIAQSARTLLAIGLQAVRRLLMATVAVLPFEALGVIKSLRIDALPEFSDHPVKERRVTRKRTRFDQGRLDGQILFRLLQAILDAAYAVSNIEANVPEGADQEFNLPGARLIKGFRQEDQDVDIRSRPQLGTPITTNRAKRHGIRQARLGPQIAQNLVDQMAALIEKPRRIGIVAGKVLLTQRELPFLYARFIAGKEPGTV